MTAGPRADYLRLAVKKTPRPRERDAENPIGTLYRRMSGWYVVFSILLFVVILVVGFRLARPLLPHLFAG